MEKQYHAPSIENKWGPAWAEQVKTTTDTDKNNYCIILPPPNVTGSLHMGHGFQLSIMDALIRKHRMQGDNTLWQVGSDHAGIATQMVVERQLAADGITRHDLGREAFEKKVWNWKQQSGQTIMKQVRRMGASVDWSRECFSLDPQFQHAVKKVFCDLFHEGIIYRGKKLINWDPVLNTALSDLEVINTPTQGKIWTLEYPLTDGSGAVQIATTRPETMLGDTAVAVHPDDERYQSIIGKTIALPLCDREIPIITDHEVDPEFGTGCVKITPAHDFNDNQMGQRHQLPQINIFTDDAHINDQAPAAFIGLERFEARKAVLAAMDERGLLVATDDHALQLPVGDRSGAVVEPMLKDQWFLKATELAPEAIDAFKKGDLNFVPENWSNTYLRWMEDIQDWCISRQLWWGHRIPAWYDEAGNIYVGECEQSVRAHYKLDDSLILTQESDVLDTWFSASLWPFVSLGWPEQTPCLDHFFPNSVLVTGFDIIFFWVARMVMMSLKLTGKVPFSDVYITGLIRDSFGQKMSKSKGNIIDPIDIIDGISLDDLCNKRVKNLMQQSMANDILKKTKQEYPEGITAYGTDALRFTFCALASTGRDINFSMGRIEGYRNFCNKLWNASRFSLMNTEGHTYKNQQSEHIIDQWIESRLNRCIMQVNQYFDQYRLDLVAQSLYEFFWNDFCDWYLELSKVIFNSQDESEQQKQATRDTLLRVLESYLRLAHPVIPFITEEIWQTIKTIMPQETESIMLAPYPQTNNQSINQATEEQITCMQAIITASRTIRAELNIAPGKAIRLYLTGQSKEESQALQTMEALIKQLARCEQLCLVEDKTTIPESATQVVGHIEVHIPLAGLIDLDAEVERLNKEIGKLDKEQQKSHNKLNNENYIKKAPEAVVEKERQRHAQTQAALKTLHEQLEKTKKLAIPAQDHTD